MFCVPNEYFRNCTKMYSNYSPFFSFLNRWFLGLYTSGLFLLVPNFYKEISALGCFILARSAAYWISQYSILDVFASNNFFTNFQIFKMLCSKFFFVYLDTMTLITRCIHIEYTNKLWILSHWEDYIFVMYIFNREQVWMYSGSRDGDCSPVFRLFSHCFQNFVWNHY